jgi:hypothetical protein
MASEWKTGGCHCGAVRFEALADWSSALSCNCSICEKKGYLHVIVERGDFRLTKGQETLQGYEFGTKTAKHFFCRVCGITSFYVPRSHPDGFSINLRCVDGIDLAAVRVEPFDGRRWEEARAKLED